MFFRSFADVKRRNIYFKCTSLEKKSFVIIAIEFQQKQKPIKKKNQRWKEKNPQLKRLSPWKFYFFLYRSLYRSRPAILVFTLISFRFFFCFISCATAIGLALTHRINMRCLWNANNICVCMNEKWERQNGLYE